MFAVNVASPTFYHADSFGRLALELAAGVRALGVHVNEIGYAAREKVLHPTWGGFLLGYPTQYSSLSALVQRGKRVGVTMYESTRIPDGWAEILNTWNAVVVPAHFLVDVFRNSGVTVPIHVAPLGISETFFQTLRRTMRRKRIMRFMAIVDGGSRKNWMTALLAFNKAFGNDMRYQLVLKARKNAFTRRPHITNPNVKMVFADYSDERLLKLYHECHVMIFPTRGEGFGLPPREFAATGGVALATAWGGTADDVEQWGIPIPYQMQPAWGGIEKWEGRNGDWADPDVTVLANQLQLIATDFEPYADHAMQAAEFVRATYSWQQFAERCYSVYASNSQ